MTGSPYSPNQQKLGRSKVDTVFRAALKDEKNLLKIVQLEVSDIYHKISLSTLLMMVKSGTIVSDNIVSALSVTDVPSDRLMILLSKVVQGRIFTTDEIIKLLDKEHKFIDSKQLEARAVDYQRKQMNKYWTKETKRFKDDVAASIRESIRKGHTQKEAAVLLRSRVGVSESRSTLIATDQLLTAAAIADRRRQRQLGVTAYTWVTVGDSRVRPAHVAKDGEEFTWSSPGEKPGDAIRCRCRGIPILD